MRFAVKRQPIPLVLPISAKEKFPEKFCFAGMLAVHFCHLCAGSEIVCKALPQYPKCRSRCAFALVEYQLLHNIRRVVLKFWGRGKYRGKVCKRVGNIQEEGETTNRIDKHVFDHWIKAFFL